MGGVLKNVPPPVDDPIAQPKRLEFGKNKDPQEGKVTRSWLDYLVALGTAVQSAPAFIASAVLTNQTASIGATDISTGLLSAGLYEFKYSIRITTAGGAGHTVTVTLDWIVGGVARAFSGTALDGTVLANAQSESQLIRIDSLSPVRYSTTVAAGGAPTMVYALDVVLTEVQA